ncbi:MAG: hypothetical protein JKY53_13655 [Flavobacteriales bacterium]|nr:hypothetical protein [Flavobacteriales bacterium]
MAISIDKNAMSKDHFMPIKSPIIKSDVSQRISEGWSVIEKSSIIPNPNRPAKRAIQAFDIKDMDNLIFKTSY